MATEQEPNKATFQFGISYGFTARFQLLGVNFETIIW